MVATAPPLLGRQAAAVIALAAGLALSPSDARSSDAPLQTRYDALRDDLASSPFGRPLVLQFSGNDEAPHGHVYAVINQPIERVAQSMSRPQAWCDVMRLQTNVKLCSVQEGDGPVQLEVGITRRHTDTADSAQTLALRFEAPQVTGRRVVAQMRADEGPLGTRGYRLRFEAVPIGSQRVFVHLSYAYRTGSLARMATQAYLSTSGKDKVGFSVVGRDEQGRPHYVGGIQGVAERNTMRYFLAIESLLDTWGEPTRQTLERRWRQFHAALERYPRQLHETSLDEYLQMKRREGT